MALIKESQFSIMCANEVQEQGRLLKYTKNSQNSFRKYFKLLELVNIKEAEHNNCSPSIVSSLKVRYVITLLSWCVFTSFALWARHSALFTVEPYLPFQVAKSL